jgi:thioesterase domain-containing protein
MGGLVAFEIARQLVAQQQTVALLALIDTHRPLRSSRVHHWSNRARRLLVDDIFGRVVFHGRNFLQRGSMRSSNYAREKTRMLGKRIANQLRIDHQGNQAYLGDIYGQSSKANLLAMRRYEAQSYSGRIIVND